MRNLFGVAIVVLLLVVGGAFALRSIGYAKDVPVEAVEAGKIAMVTSLPLFTNEAPTIADAISAAQERTDNAHPLGEFWVQTLQPVLYDDAQAAIDSESDLLILAQPRPLLPDEMVALDKWLQSGGRLLLFADPELHWPSIYPLGDPRRPESTNLLSPLMNYWGLEQRIDEDQSDNVWQAETNDQKLAVIQAGHFAVISDNGGDIEIADHASCVLKADGLLALCKIGRGRAVIVADADMLQAEFFQQKPANHDDALPENGNWRGINMVLRLVLDENE